MSKTLKNGEYQYNQADFLGQGSFAKVFKGIITKNQRVVAVRILSLKLLKQYGNRIKDIINGEISVLIELAQLSHPDAIFTTEIYDCFLTEHNVVMILEFCPDGNLEDIVSNEGPLSEQRSLEIAFQLARGLQFISKKKVVHRDIKPDNVFIKKEAGHTVYKLGDFGFAVKKEINKDIVGTPIFMSPELFREEPYGSEVDVWAYGLLVHYLIFKQNYFIAATEEKVKEKVLKSRYTLTPKHLQMISPATADFLQGCLMFEKEKRLKAENLSSHPAFNSIRQKIEVLVKDITKLNALSQSQLRKLTAKGKYFSMIVSYNFLFDIAENLVKRQNNNLASLYLLKYCLSDLNTTKSRILKGQNVIQHSDWDNFATTTQFQNSFKIIDSIIARVKNAFQSYFTSVMNSIGPQYPQVAQGIASNLGNSPFAPINPQIPIYQLKNSWLAKLGTSPEDYYLKISIFVVICLMEKKQLQLDFCALQQSKNSVSLSEAVSMIETALKTSKI